MSTATKAGIQTLEVIVRRIRHTSEGFSVYSGDTEGRYKSLLTIKQFTGPVQPGQRWVVCGKQLADPKWGEQFAASFATLAAPQTAQELELFCCSGLVDGWGWREYAEMTRLMSPEEALSLCRAGELARAGLENISQDALQSLRDAWQRGTALASVYADLAAWGVSGRVSDALVRHYGDRTIARLTEDPYRDLLDIDGYGWKTAESIGLALGIDRADSRRVTAGIELAVQEEAWQKGHTWLTRGQAISAAMRLLHCSWREVEGWVEQAIERGHIIPEGNNLVPEPLHRAEGVIACELARRTLMAAPLVEHLRAIERSDPRMTDDQWLGVITALTQPISLLTGGPGVGKTTCLKALVTAAHELGIEVTCMAPTGKAAARMAEATGHPASTIHSALKITPGSLDGEPLGEPIAGLVIVDEVSMLDTQLAAALLSRLSPKAQILLVGDPDQLPSVGPGAVLRDLLDACIMSRVHLDKVFRNDQGIAINAKRIREGEEILSLDDCRIMPADDPEEGAYQVMQILNSERTAGLALGDVLVLCPTNDGPSGRYELNKQLQPRLNTAPVDSGIKQYMPSALDTDGTIRKRSEEIRRGDRVMVTKNIRDLRVFNGQTGVVVDVAVPRSIDVEIDGAVVTFSGEHKRALTLAYAITGHKSQGSEAPVVIVPVFPSRVLSREWLYTVLTRAKSRAYLVGSVEAIQGCLGVCRGHQRRTGLVDKIMQAMAGGEVAGDGTDL